MRRIGAFAVVVLVVVAAVGCSPAPTPGQAYPARVHPEALHITGAKAVTARGPVRLSPDGTHLLRLDSSLCVTALDGSGERCVSGGPHPDALRAQWSPDGTKIAFTDDFWRLLREPDVWVFDVRSGELKNLTDDGVDELRLGERDPAATIDLLPSWSPDGKFVRFARGYAGADTMSLMSIGLEGGEVAAAREIHCGTSELVALAWSENRVAWTCGVGDAEVRAAEISRVREWTVLPAGDGGAGEDRMLLSFSPDGESLLVDSQTPYAARDVTGGRAVVVPADGGRAYPVARGEVGYPAWVPGADAIAYVDLPGSLKVVPNPDTGREAPPRELRSAKGFAATDGMRLTWGKDQLFALVDGDPTLLGVTDQLPAGR
jgi:hypothetical protein